MRRSIATGLLVGATLLALPAASSSQAPGSATPSLAKPLASCYSPTLKSQTDSRSEADIATDLLGPPGFIGNLLIVDSDVDGTLTDGGGVAGGRGFVSQLDFDASGRASAKVIVRLPFVGSPAEAVNVRLQGRRPASPENPAPADENVLLGMTKIAALGVQIGDPSRPSSGPTSRPKSVVVSGAPFAGKTLYGFIVEFKAPRRSFGQDPARFSRKVVRRVTLGRADACGYVKKKVALNAKVRPGLSYQLYVNAGPKLDKARAVYGRI